MLYITKKIIALTGAKDLSVSSGSFRAVCVYLTSENNPKNSNLLKNTKKITSIWSLGRYCKYNVSYEVKRLYLSFTIWFSDFKLYLLQKIVSPKHWEFTDRIRKKSSSYRTTGYTTHLRRPLHPSALTFFHTCQIRKYKLRVKETEKERERESERKYTKLCDK